MDQVNKSGLVTIKAKLKLLETEAGGRKTGIKSGYRPNHVFEYRDNQIYQTYAGDVKFEDQETIEPGEAKIVTVRFILGQSLEKYLQVGRRWWIYEVPHLIGEAEIVEI
jgi:translation elongation factor EF-Tu-like GTPase